MMARWLKVNTAETKSKELFDVLKALTTRRGNQSRIHSAAAAKVELTRVGRELFQSVLVSQCSYRS